MSTCFSFVSNFSVSFITKRIVCRLSQVTVSLESRLKLIFLNTRRHQKSHTHMCDRDSNSASVDNVVTVLYSWQVQSIHPPNSWNMPPSMLHLFIVSSANKASVPALKTGWIVSKPSYRARNRVLYRYTRHCSTTSWCFRPGFVRNRASFE
jgi:hypothetical protein